MILQRPGGATENHLLYDDGTNGDKMPDDDYWEVEIPNAAQAPGSYLLRGEFYLTKDGCTVRRETEYAVTAQSDPQECVRTICPKPRPARAGEAVGVMFCARNLCRADDEVEVTLTDVRRNVPVTFSLTRDAFSEALRVMMYYMPTNRKVPLLIHRASEGDFKPFIQTGIQSNRQIRGQPQNPPKPATEAVAFFGKMSDIRLNTLADHPQCPPAASEIRAMASQRESVWGT